MGFSSLFAKFGKSKSKDIAWQPLTASRESNGDFGYGNLQSPRQSTARSASRPRTADNASKLRRMSRFGETFASRDDVPELPYTPKVRNAWGEELARPTSSHRQAHKEPPPPPPPEADNKEKRKSRRLSLGRALSRKRSEPAMSTRSRMSAFYPSQSQSHHFEALPPMPAVPVYAEQSKPPATASIPAEKRMSRRLSKRASAANLGKRLSRTIWTSSNPDDSVDDREREREQIPPMPALVRSNTTTPDSGEDEERNEIRQINKPRPLSVAVHVKSPPAGYRPKSAGRAFLKTTSQATDEQRKSFRKSMGIGDNDPMVCFSSEQAKEWERLKELISALDDKQPASTEESRSAYANDQALAALEFNGRA